MTVFNRERWGIDWTETSDSIVFRSCKGELTVTRTYGGVVVHGEVLLGRWDGREPTTDKDFDYDKFRPAHETQTSFSEVGIHNKTFPGKQYGAAKFWASQKLVVVPITVPFDVAIARTTGEGMRDWRKFLDVLIDELEAKRIKRSLDAKAYAARVCIALKWDGEGPLPEEDYFRALYDKRVLKSN